MPNPTTGTFLVLLLSGLLLCAPGCSALPLLPPSFEAKPQVELLSPADHSTLLLGDQMPVRANARDSAGIVRFDLILDGLVIHSQQLVFALVEADYQYTWRPAVAGAHTLTLIASNSHNRSSDPVTINVTINAPTLAPVKATPLTPTPFVVIVTSVGPPTAPPTWTPRVVIVTPSARPSLSPTATRSFTPTPIIRVVTRTPSPQ